MVVLAFLICLLASSIGGICGVGGGVVIKPVMDAMKMGSVSTISFLSGLTVLSMAVVNVIKSRKSKELELRSSVPLGIGAAIGGVAGKSAFEAIKQMAGNDRVVGACQSVILGLMVLGTLLYMVNKARIVTRRITNPGVGAGIGLALGMASSFLGIGGGPMNLVVLYYFFSMKTKQASINSILVILISQTTSLMLTLIRGKVPSFDAGMLICMMTAGIAGGFISSYLHKRISGETTDKLFRLLLLVILLICVYNTINVLR